MKVLIVGGVAGGATAAARLRRLDEKAEIIIFEKGEFVSFANCGLPYYIGGVIGQKGDLAVQTPSGFKSRFNVDVRTLSEVVSLNTKEKHITVKCLKTGNVYEESYDQLILSPGAKPFVPNIDITDLDGVFTLRSIPDAQKIKNHISEKKPTEAVIIGGGYIGLETAENLSETGIRVTVVERSDHLIAPLDFDMSADVHSHLRAHGIELELSNGVRAVERAGKKLRVILERGEIYTDTVIIAVGVKPDTEFLIGSGVELNARGQIKVNERMQTNADGVYAVGDAAEIKNAITGKNAFIALAGPANKQGRIAADNICSIPSQYAGSQGSSVLKLFDMTVAATGLNERSAIAEGFDYDKTYISSASHATYYPDAKMMLIKILWDKKSLRILGAQIVGYDGVDKRMDVIATAMRLGARVTDLATLELCYAPPYSSAKDPVNMIGFVAENVITEKIKQFFWHDIEALPRDGSVTLLDTRTPAEAARGSIEGFINIPLDTLRERISQIPEGKPIYVHCHSGLRSYIACRILSGYGFECYNLAGGWRLYNSVISEKRFIEIAKM